MDLNPTPRPTSAGDFVKGGESVDYIGYWFLWVGVALLVYEIGDNYALVKYENDKKPAQWQKIYYTRSGRAYIVKRGHRYYFDECIRKGF